MTVIIIIEIPKLNKIMEIKWYIQKSWKNYIPIASNLFDKTLKLMEAIKRGWIHALSRPPQASTNFVHTQHILILSILLYYIVFHVTLNNSHDMHRLSLFDQILVGWGTWFQQWLHFNILFIYFCPCSLKIFFNFGQK